MNDSGISAVQALADAGDPVARRELKDPFMPKEIMHFLNKGLKSYGASHHNVGIPGRWNMKIALYIVNEYRRDAGIKELTLEEIPAFMAE